MKNLLCIVLLIAIYSCNSAGEWDNYLLVTDNLYKDKAGNLYFKAYDKSDGDTIVRYLDVVYSEKFGLDGIKKMKEVIDEKTFRYDGDKKIYVDKNNRYVFKEMTDGGTLILIDDDIQLIK